MGGEIFLYHFREKFSVGDALTILTTSDAVADVMMEANKAGFKLVFNKKDITSIQSFLTSVLNNRTLDLNGRILFVEDQQSLAESTISLFKSYGTQVDHVKNTKDATKLFSTKNYDLVITDYYLKGHETGDDVITLVRNSDDLDKAHTPILVVSGETDPKKRTAFLRHGANDFIIKPFDPDELIVRSSNLIHNQRVFEQVKQQKQELLQLAMTDQLTHLFNRHSLFEIGPKYLSDAKRHNFPVSLVVIDLDHFKNVNDTHGHATGDVVLKSIGQVLKEDCRTEDFVARFGGEEFVMLLSHCDIEFAVTKAENLRKEVEATRPSGLTITASLGVAAMLDNDDFNSLFEKADKAVYKAKESGRNKVVAHTS
jgi:two-component system cell cycle response regulator